MRQRLNEKIALLLVIFMIIGAYAFAESQGKVSQTPFDSTVSQEMPSHTLESDGSRVALIIGNSSYRHMNVLTNPSNDAEDISRLLSQVGFEAELLLDGSLTEIEAAARSFLDKSKSEEVATSLFFYAGHAVQYEGSNYLIPVDADIQREHELIGKAYNMDVLLKGLERSSSDLNLIILDACRDNPFSTTRGGARGLSAMGFGTAESMVVFATAPGSVAEDGEGRNSPFTNAMKEHLPTPDLEVRQLIAQVSKSVQEQTKGRQIPWVNTSFTGQFFFLTGEQEFLLRQGQLATLSKELAQLDAEYLVMQEEIANTLNDDDRSRLELEQKRIAALATAKRLETERIQRLQAEAELRLATQQEQLRAKQLLQTKLSEEGHLLEQLAQKRRIELDNLAQQRVSSAGAMSKLKTIAQYEQTIVDVRESYNETIRLSSIEFANLEREQVDSYRLNDPQDPWETLKEFQDRVNSFEATLIADSNRQIAEIERQRNQDINQLWQEMEAYKREASNIMYTIGHELTDTQVNAFIAERKYFPFVVVSKDADFPFTVMLDYQITATERKAIGEEYNRIETAAKADALTSTLHYSIKEISPLIWVVTLERYELFNLLEEVEQELSPILVLDKTDLQVSEYIFRMEMGQPKLCYAITEFGSDLGEAIVYRDGVEISRSGAKYVVDDEASSSFIASFVYKNGIIFEAYVWLKPGVNGPVRPQTLIRPKSNIPIKIQSVYYSDLESFNSRVNNEDGRVSAGESIRLDAAVYNDGYPTVKGLRATFSTISSYVSIDREKNTIIYGDLEGKKYQTLNGIYANVPAIRYSTNNASMVQMTVWQWAPVGSVVPVKVVFTDALGRTWEDAFSFTITAPNVKIKYVGSSYSDLESFNSKVNNGDKRVNAGETIFLDAAVQNEGYAMVKGLRATFSTTSPYVTIDKDKNTINYGDLAGGKYRTLNGTYSKASEINYSTNNSSMVQMTVRQWTPTGTVVPMKVVYTDVIGRTWEEEFSFNITAPDVRIRHERSYYSDLESFDNKVNNGDNRVNPGETIRLDSAVYNGGFSKVKGLRATFSTTSPYVNIEKEKNTIYYGDLAGYRYRTLYDTFTNSSDIRYYTNSSSMVQMTIRSWAPVGTVVPMKVVYTDVVGRTWEDEFSFVVVK